MSAVISDVSLNRLFRVVLCFPSNPYAAWRQRWLKGFRYCCLARSRSDYPVLCCWGNRRYSARLVCCSCTRRICHWLQIETKEEKTQKGRRCSPNDLKIELRLLSLQWVASACSFSCGNIHVGQRQMPNLYEEMQFLACRWTKLPIWIYVVA